MSIVNGSLQVAGGNNAWHTTYAAEIPLARQIVLNTQTGQYKIGDGSTALSGLTYYGGSGYTFTGNTSQYVRGDGSYATFPTAVSSFTNDAGYLTSSAIGVTVQGYSANTTLLGNSTTGSGSIVLATSPTFQTSLNAAYSTASTIAIFDSNRNLISADTATYPSLTELSYSKGVTSAIQTQLNSKVAIICENMPMAAMNASTTYYWSNLFTTNASGPRTTVGQSLVSLPYSGTIIGASITCLTFNAGVSTNAMTISMRIAGVDNQISNTAAFSSSASSPQQYNITGLNIAYTAGQAYEIKCVTPAWSSAPSLAIIRVALHIRY